jgi:hypothetical protein
MQDVVFFFLYPHARHVSSIAERVFNIIIGEGAKCFSLNGEFSYLFMSDNFFI